MDQRDAFSRGEGDNYYRRNRSKLVSVQALQAEDQVLAGIQQIHVRPRRILEIGCSNGWRLDLLRLRYSADCYGIDPSAEAIRDGGTSFPHLSLRTGTAENLPYSQSMFDLVVFGFCLYLCDRQDLFVIVAEADRVLADEGHLVLFDFHPPFPYRAPYAHHPGLYSYKADYPSAFLWNPAYARVWQFVFPHGGNESSSPDDQVSVTIMRKSTGRAYIDNPFD